MTQPSLFADEPAAPRRRADSGPRYTPEELARLLRLPRPTAEGPAPGEIPVGAVVLAAMPANRVWRMRAADGRTLTLKPRPVLRLSSLLMAREATLAGAGIALLPKLLVAAQNISQLLQMKQ